MSPAPAVHFRPAAGAAERSPVAAFSRFCSDETGLDLSRPADLHAFSVREVARFWALFLEWSALDVDGEPTPVLEGEGVEHATFFPALRLNYAWNLVRPIGDEDAPALTACDEQGVVTQLSRATLRESVARLALGLRGLGVERGTRVVAIARNAAETAVACLAATALGATWSSISPDLGVESIRARFGQLSPTVLFAHQSYVYQGKRVDVAAALRAIAADLPSLAAIVTLDGTHPDGLGVPVHDQEGLIARHEHADAFDWPPHPFNHPLFILFSSGTTGAPKCIVHGAGGTLIEHHKEHRLHCGLTPDDTLFFHTTCGWMMWNWLLSGLAVGAHVVVYDGSVSYPADDQLLQVVRRQAVTVFGTSPVYLQYLRASGIDPAERFELPALRSVLSTGSVLYPHQFTWVREHLKAVPVESISGGTDIIGCFVLGHPLATIREGYSPSISLGMDVRAMTADGPLTAGTGELVCATPFPSRPVGLFGDRDGERFHAAYFAENPGYWTHGDFIELTGRGSARILGRADGVLNIRGIRIGPAEIYSILQDFPEIHASMALAQEDERALGGKRLVLLVVMADGHALDRPLTLRMKRALKERASMAHVPSVVAAVPALPTTHSGKVSERAAQDTLDGREIRNRGALRNPECLEAIAQHPALG